ncbi:MAG: endonuclease/exonuclease/phosphatase family protein, partial [Verrucomicrobia bacterium]
MRQFVLKTVVVCLVALVGPTSSRAQQVTVMHWNVHGNLGTFSAQSGPEALAIARILNYLQPDVFLINEVADGAATTNTIAITQWVSTNLPYLASGSYYVSVSTESSSIQRNAVISRYPVANTFTYPDVSSGLRGMFSFQLQLAGTNRLQVFYVHLKCCSDGSSCQTKQDEADLFSGEMADFAATNGSPYIFAGDLNEDNLNPECTLSATYHPIDTLITNGGLAEFKPTTLSGEYRTWSTASTPSIRFDYILAATNRLAPTSGFVFSTKDWAVHGLYTNASAQNLTSDSATASDHYSVFVTYNFPTGTVALAVSPASAFASSGNQGGPFTPTNQIYTLSNISASSINWAATKTANWLTLSATNGNLAGGASTNISVSLNVNANSLSAGNNSDNVVFTNLSNTGDSITRAANLTVNATAGQLAVTPVSGFTFAGLAGGPFAPVSQTYTLSNSGN